MNVHTIKQYVLRIYFQFLRVWWFIRRPHTRGVKCLIEHDGTFLLVRLSYGHRQWSIPGGGVNPQESFETAAKRGVLEETGIIVTELSILGNYSQTIEYKNDTVQCYHTVVPTRGFTIDNFEISEAQWFAIDELPTDRSPNVDRVLHLYESHKN